MNRCRRFKHEYEGEGTCPKCKEHWARRKEKTKYFRAEGRKLKASIDLQKSKTLDLVTRRVGSVKSLVPCGVVRES